MSRTTGTYFVMTLERAKAPAESPSPAMAAAAAYTVAEADLDRDREAILAVWRRNLPDKELAAAKFDWYYRSNPLGSGRIWKLIADSTGEIVGTAGMGRRRLRCCRQQCLPDSHVEHAPVEIGDRTLRWTYH